MSHSGKHDLEIRRLSMRRAVRELDEAVRRLTELAADGEVIDILLLSNAVANAGADIRSALRFIDASRSVAAAA